MNNRHFENITRCFFPTMLTGLFLCAGCKTETALIPGYEVLPFPADTNKYTAGNQWLPEIGSSGDSLAPVKVSAGLSQDSIEKTNGTSVNFALPLIKWISGSLGKDDKDVTVLEMTNLSLITVSQAKDIAAPVLWETVVVSNFAFRVGQAGNALASVAFTPSQFVPISTNNLQLTVTNQSDGSHFIQTDHPLVLAIRVVKPKQRSREYHSHLDLSDLAVGQNQIENLGYEMTLQSPVDPIKKEATLCIKNSWTSEFQGTNQIFLKSNAWIGSSRQAIEGVDPEAVNADYIWDSISIEWNTDLKNCSLEIVRQYRKLVPMKSGLAGTR